ncbi:Aste57867_20405 [Aphanomyces stellatus]|uniref:Aste57867_20405 protein n=1 Tax=Aphanomyces stellatus TaxID=120398 RepID=A0A485LF09_9STRA|nr:hypothetical protein As57867_020339 [Aphanomyces stellatus]VFT97091.1 Aste57867_20405 [Aphanomyces stellatus]
MRVWALAFTWATCTGLTDDTIFLPWRSAVSEDATLWKLPALKEGSATSGHDNDTGFTFPACEQARPLDVDCKYNILVAIADSMDGADVDVADGWIEYMRQWTETEIYLIQGRQCAISWTRQLLHVQPPRRVDHPCRTRTPVACLEDDVDDVAAMLLHSDTNPAHESHQALISPTKAKSTERFDAMVGFFSHAVEYNQMASFGQAHAIPRLWSMFHSSSTTSMSNLHAWSSRDSLLALDLLHMWAFHRVEMPYQCASVLPHGVPVLRIDSSSSSPRASTRRCLCQCPMDMVVNFVGGQHVCQDQTTTADDDACVHHRIKYGYDITEMDHDATNQCRVRHVVPRPIRHLPYPTRRHPTNASMVVQVVRHDNAIVFERLVAWTPPDPAPHGGPRQSLLQNAYWTAPGLYRIHVGWRNGTMCEASLAITDRVRPESLAQCPTTLPPSADDGLPSTRFGDRRIRTAEYSVQNLLAATAAVDQHYVYATHVRNDACSTTARCDVTHFARRDFFDDFTQPAPFASGRHCFADPLDEATLDRLRQSPFGSELERVAWQAPVADGGQCTRCCYYETELKEWWVDYSTQDPDASPSMVKASTCSGNGAVCRTEQCLTGFGRTFFAAAATAMPLVQANTMALLRTLYPALVATVDPSNEVHVLLECASFGQTQHGVCAYETTLASLVDLTAQVKDHTIVIAADERPFVQWRYRHVRRQTTWRSITGDSSDELQFDTPASTLALEAWSQCGLVAAVNLSIVLHLETPVCPDMDQMWYQSSSESHFGDMLQLYQRSAIAELTFDFDAATAGFHCDDVASRRGDDAQWTPTDVVCMGQFPGRAPALVVDHHEANTSLVRRFAIDPTDSHVETFQIECTFTYAHKFRPQRQVHVTATKRFRMDDRRHDDRSIVFVTHDEPACPGAKLHQLCRGVVVRPGVLTTQVTHVASTCCGDAVCAPLFSLAPDDERQDISLCAMDWNDDALAPCDEDVYLPLVFAARPMEHDTHFLLMGVCVVAGLGCIAVLVVSRSHALDRCRDDETCPYELCRAP